jgi:hypothetical protein
MLHLLLLTLTFSFTPVLTAPAGFTCHSGETISGTTCTQECNTDRFGGDFHSIQVASVQECALACNQDDRCLTAQYHNGNHFCYLKSALNGPQNSDVVDGIVCRQPSVPTQDPGSCPANILYTTTSGCYHSRSSK